MTFDPVKPRYTLPFAGADYELEGSFALIEAVEYALKDGILTVLPRVLEMPAHELAKLLATILTSCGHKATAKEMTDRLWNEVGLSGDANTLLRLHLHAFLRICVAPPADREKAAADLGELLGEVEPRFPWKEYQEIALGVLRWSEDQFWRSNVWSFARAWDGYCKAKGIAKDDSRYPTQEERDELHRKLRERAMSKNRG